MITTCSNVREQIVTEMVKRLHGGTIATLDQDGNELMSLPLSVRVSEDGKYFGATSIDTLPLDERVKKIVWRSPENEIVWQEPVTGAKGGGDQIYSLTTIPFKPHLIDGISNGRYTGFWFDPQLILSDAPEKDSEWWTEYAAEHQEEWDREDAEWYQAHFGED